MLQKNKKHSDSTALTESLLIAVWRLLGDGLALSVCFAATSRVAAPSVCFAAARILLAAAPTAPPYFRHWRRSSLLLPQRGSHWRVGQAHAGRAKFTLSENSSALLQRAAASRQEHLVKLL